jgi:hypothetical protein
MEFAKFKAAIIILLLISVFGIGLNILPLELVKGADENWLNGWHYRIPITATQTANTNCNYTIQLVVYNTTGSNSGMKVYIGSNSLSTNFGDIRFTDSTGKGLLNFWQQIVTSTYSVFWVNMSGNLSLANQIIYLYSANKGQITTSDLANTFPISEDFSSSIGANFTWTNQPNTPASYDVSSSNLTINNGGQKVDLWNTVDTAYQLRTTPISPNYFEALLKFYHTPTAEWQQVGIIVKQDSTNWVLAKNQWLNSSSPNTVVDIAYDVAGTSATSGSYARASAYYYRFKCINNVYSLKYSIDPTAWTTFGPTQTQSLANPTVGLFLKTGSLISFSSTFDWFIIRRAVAIEPKLTFGTSQSSTSYNVTTFANSGGTITNTSSTAFYEGDNATVNISADAGNMIDSILLDGEAIKNFTISQKNAINSTNTCAKVTIVSGQRYILTSNWMMYGSITSDYMQVFAADSDWTPTGLVTTSPCKVSDIYIPTFSLNDSIFVVGRADVTKGFVAKYNLTTRSWTWANQTNVHYVTNAFNPTGTSVFIQTAVNASVAFYKTTLSGLFTPSAWTVVTYPSWGLSSKQEMRIAFFNDMLYGLVCDVSSTLDFSYALGRYNITSSTWEGTALMNLTDTAKTNSNVYVFGYLTASLNMVVVTLPFSNGSYSAYYSTDGTTFSFITNVLSPTVAFAHSEAIEFHCWAEDYKGEGKFFVLSNSGDDLTSGYISIIDKYGDILSRGTVTSHNTEVWNLVDGNYLIQGAEISQCGSSLNNPAAVKRVLINYTIKSPNSIIFTKLRGNHTVSATFHTWNPGQVNSVFILLNADPISNYSKGQQVTFPVIVLNQQNSQLEAKLTLAITCSEGYSFYDFQPIDVTANSVGEYSFSWVVPDGEGKYVVAASLVSMRLTAYDTKWLQIGESTSESSDSNWYIFNISINLISGTLLILALFVSKSLAVIYTVARFGFKVKVHPKRERYYSKSKFLCSGFG